MKTATAMNVELSSEFPDSQGEKGNMETCFHISIYVIYNLIKGSVSIFSEKTIFWPTKQ